MTYTLNICVLVCARYKENHVVTARAAVTVIHPELGCLISSTQLQNYSVILLYAEHGSSPGQHIWLPATVKLWGGHSKKVEVIAGWLGRWWSSPEPKAHLPQQFTVVHSGREKLHTVGGSMQV